MMKDPCYTRQQVESLKGIRLHTMVRCCSTSQLSSSSSVKDIACLLQKINKHLSFQSAEKVGSFHQQLMMMIVYAVSTMNYDTMPTMNDLIRMMD